MAIQLDKNVTKSIRQIDKTISKANESFKELKKKDFMKHAFGSSSLRQMSDGTFLDFVMFYSKQPDVDQLESVRKAMDTRALLNKTEKKSKKKEKFSIELVQRKVQESVSITIQLFFVAFFILIIFSICYGLWYWQKDPVKSSICFNLLLMAIGSSVLFIVFWFLYMVIALSYKKIILLM